ncbi:MAG: 4-alpha-glucanotransferase [Acetobacteraceae bacterium]
MLKAMRFDVGSDGALRDGLAHLAQSRHRRVVPWVLTVRGATPGILALPLDDGLSQRSFWLVIALEDGETIFHRVSALAGVVVDGLGCDGRAVRTWRVELPPLPAGRHRLWRDDMPEVVCRVTVAPERCHLPDFLLHGGKRFGIGAQLYALPRDGDQGIGDFTTLTRLAVAARDAGAATVGINPLHMLFPAQRERASPYHPSDRRFIDPIYLDVPEVEPLPPSDNLIAYGDVWTRKLAALEARFATLTLSDPVWEELQTFIATGGERLCRFAIFQAIAERYPDQTWRQWPGGLEGASSPAVANFAQAHAQRVTFHQYLQFLADRQLAAVARSGLELGLFRDLAVGAAPDGAEAWAQASELADSAWVGAPPDPFAAQGQNWHLPPPLPRSMCESGYTSFAALIAANVRHAGVLRIDHAMGLQRLFWIPDGASGAEGAYVSYPLDGLLGELALESTRNGCVIVGEDLGTVPDGFRSRMSENGMLGYRVLLLEREGRDFRDPTEFPDLSMACVTTHDLAPMAGWLEGDDIREQAQLGLLISESEADSERNIDRSMLEKHLARRDLLSQRRDEPPCISEIVTAVHALVAQSGSMLAIVQADDLAGERIPINLPGTDRERPNWRRRLQLGPESILSNALAEKICDAMVGVGRAASQAARGGTHEGSIASANTHISDTTHE